MYDETIAAISTGLSEGGIGIVRISGDQSLAILGKMFSRAMDIEVGKLTYGHIFDKEGQTVDEVMAVYMKAPHSYTCEDVVEIQCHGSIVSVRKILDLAIEYGARLAERGEFTKRAFLNGRLDLSQAEAVIDLIKAKTDKTYDAALAQLTGSVSKEIRAIRESLIDVLVDVDVNIDYPDEDIEILTYNKLIAGLTDAEERIEKLLASVKTGKIMRDGLSVSIIGKPNVGKSSLMNALLRESRAIVTDIPGTTRDTIEESLSVRGIPVRLTDTAGIRESLDVIEKIGIERSKEAVSKSDLVIFVVDSSRALSEEDFEIMDYLDGLNVLVVINKCDLPKVMDEEELSKRLPGAKILRTSMAGEAEKDENISATYEIEDAIEGLVYGGKVAASSDALITSERQAELLKKAKSSICDAIEIARLGEPFEVIEIDVNSAFESLGLILGEEADGEILNEIFKRFCLGK